MDTPGDVSLTRRVDVRALGGGFAAVIAAVALFTRFGINGLLSRDESIYTYGGQQLSHGVAPYTSIFDPKSPLATIIAGAAAGLAHVLHRNDVAAIRAAFFLCACLTVLAVYLLVLRLWGSVVGAVVAAVVFVSFTGFAEDALSGPDAKTPGILAAVVAMWLSARRQWLLAGAAGALAFLVWQPLVVYPVVTFVVAIVNADEGRRRRAAVLAAGGALAPVVATVVGFAAGGALSDLYGSTVDYPMNGVVRGTVTFTGRFTRIASVIHTWYGVSGVLLWCGMAAVVLLAGAHVVRGRMRGGALTALRDPLVFVVLLTGLGEMLYALYDFQGYPDVYPLLPYGAIGLGGLTAIALRWLGGSLRWQVGAGAALAAVGVLAGFSWTWFGNDPQRGLLRAQRANACALERILGDDGRFYDLGNPSFLVLTHRRNPDRFVYLAAGVDDWKVKHTTGGFEGWVQQVEAAQPAVIGIGGWTTALRVEMGSALRTDGYIGRYAGNWRLLMTKDALVRARQEGVRLTKAPTLYATGPQGHELPASGC